MGGQGRKGKARVCCYYDVGEKGEEGYLYSFRPGDVGLLHTAVGGEWMPPFSPSLRKRAKERYTLVVALLFWKDLIDSATLLCFHLVIEIDRIFHEIDH